MKTHNKLSTVFLLLIVLIFLSQSLLMGLVPAFGATTNTFVKRALLIGIGKYEILPRLPGSKNDIDLVRQVLMSRYGFSDENVHVVLDEAATRVGVLAALNKIVKEASPNDIVYIHYSGHGSQVQDLDGDESDQLDETIVPQDGRTDGVPDITDDELEVILSQLKTSQAVVVLDSCHSGTATRGLDVEVRSRFVPTDTRVRLYENNNVRTRALVPLNKHAYVLFSGAASHEEALDGPVDGRYHGFFTHSLFKSLQAAPTGASTREIFAGAKDELKRIQNQFGRTSMPEPQLEASKARIEQPFFVVNRQSQATAQSASGEARRSWVTVQLQEGKDHVLVNAVSLGADLGSVWAIYPEGETAFDPAQARAFAVVNAVREGHAIARVSGSPPTMVGRAIMIASAPQSQAITMRLRHVPSDQANDLKRVLQHKLGEIEFVGPNQFARFFVDAKNHTWHVYSADGEKEVLSLPISANPKSLEPLAQVLVQSRNATQLLSLENPATQINLDVRVVQVSQRAIAVVSDRMEAPVYHVRQTGESRSLSNSLQLEVTTDTDCYITIVDVDAEGNVNVLFPNPYQNQNFYRDGFVQARRSILLPDSLRSGNRAGFHWDYANPSGVDTIRVFASTDRKLTNRIRASVGSTRDPGVEQGRITGKPMAQLVSLRKELIGSMTRGLITVPDEPMVEPAAYENDQSTERPYSESGLPQPVASDFQTAEQGMAYNSGVVHESEVVDPSAAMFVQSPVADWTAASVTVLVQP